MGLDLGLTIVAQVKWPVGENWDWLKKHSQGTALSRQERLSSLTYYLTF